MKRSMSVYIIVFAALLLMALGLAGEVAAQIDEGYELLRSSVDGGGGSLAEGEYTLSGTAGQAECGPALSGDGYSLVGGLWPGEAGSADTYNTYLPLMLDK